MNGERVVGVDVPRQEYLADNIELADGSTGGLIVCPGCGEPFCSIHAMDGIDGFEGVCAHCSAPSYLASVAVLSGRLVTARSKERATADQSDNPTVTLDELCDHVTRLWEEDIRDGFTAELAAPRGTRQKDITASVAQEHAVRADRFGWEWRPSEDLHPSLSVSDVELDP